MSDLYNTEETLKLLEKYNLKEIKVASKTILLNEGERSQNLYFIKSGCLRMWTNHNGVEITTQFFFEGKTVASMESLLTGDPSDFTLETLEPSTLLVMNKKEFLELLKNDTEFSEWLNKLILNRFFYYSKHLLTYLKNSPQERYDDLLKNHPKIFQRVPQHYIASYIGITPVSLSRIRNRKN